MLVNFFEFSTDGNCLWQKVCETENVSRSALVVAFQVRDSFLKFDYV